MFSVAQADAQTLLVSSTTVTRGDTQNGTGLVRVLDIGIPGKLAEINSLPIPGAVDLESGSISTTHPYVFATLR